MFLKKFSKITDGIFVGNTAAAEDPNIVTQNKISAMIKLDPHSDNKFNNVEYYDFIIPDQELIDFEYDSTAKKLEKIMSMMRNLRQGNHNILIFCNDGRNKCMLVAGYYLIDNGEDHNKIITKLETLHFTPEQVKDDSEDNMRGFDFDIESIAKEERERILKGRSERAAVRCLTMVSFKKLLRLKGMKKL